jgi:D-alanyl-D-alanine carboxypeptidase
MDQARRRRSTAHPIRVAAFALAVATLAWWASGPGAADDRPVTTAAPRTPAGSPPPCSVGELPARHRDPSDWARTLLDTSFTLGPDYVPPDLVPVGEVGLAGRGQVRSVVVADLRALGLAARADGAAISVDSAYRSYKAQVASFASYEAAYGTDEALRSVAKPGHSEHQLGTTIDFTGDLDWLADRAWEFGFVMSYPADRSPRLTCYKPETWHYRYVGRVAAAAVRLSGLSLREWLWAFGD